MKSSLCESRTGLERRCAGITPVREGGRMRKIPYLISGLIFVVGGLTVASFDMSSHWSYLVGTLAGIASEVFDPIRA